MNLNFPKSLIILFLFVCFVRPVWAEEKKIALVIGNSNYKSVRLLKNPANDANAIAASLKKLGFSTNVVLDQGVDDMRRAVRRFGQNAEKADIAVVYYAGHGMEIGGKNYLIPVDAALRSDQDLAWEAVTLEKILRAIRPAKKLRLVILDACRDNPFSAQMRLSGGATRSVTRGFARVEPTGNTLVAFAARHGTVANDGTGKHSPYTNALLRHLQTPDLEINFLFRRVRDSVLELTNQNQEPFVYGSLSGKPIYLKPSHELRRLRAELESVKSKLNQTYTFPSTRQSKQTASLTTNKSNSSQAIELSIQQRKNVQLALKKMGFDPGPADGKFGPRTKNAIRSAKNQLGLLPGDVVDSQFLDKLPKIRNLSTLNLPWMKQSMTVDKDSLDEIEDDELRDKFVHLFNSYIKVSVFRDKMFIFVRAKQGQQRIKEKAELMGGKLAEPRDRATSQFLKRNIPKEILGRSKKGESMGPLIGLEKNKFGKWVWASDGSTPRITDWIRGEPSNSGGYDTVAIFWKRSGRFGWNDVPNSGRWSYIIEIPL